LDRAQILSEGRRAQSPTSAAFFGSTMLTIDLATCADLVREPCDPRLATRLASLMALDPRVVRRAQQIAGEEAARLSGRSIPVRAADVRVRAQGAFLYIDVELEEPRG
jgi:hypothetical protein